MHVGQTNPARAGQPGHLSLSTQLEFLSHSRDVAICSCLSVCLSHACYKPAQPLRGAVKRLVSFFIIRKTVVFGESISSHPRVDWHKN